MDRQLRANNNQVKRNLQSRAKREKMMIGDGIEDEEKWLAAGIAGLQQNAFYMH